MFAFKAGDVIAYKNGGSFSNGEKRVTIEKVEYGINSSPPKYWLKETGTHISASYAEFNCTRVFVGGYIPDPRYKDEPKEAVNHPAHYNSGGLETLDILKAKLTSDQYEGFLVGNILKYLTRYKGKNGVEDLRKAEFYLKELINQLDE